MRRPQVPSPGHNRLTGALALELSALEADGKGKIISSPRVMTANNVEALIEQGTELPYQQATSSGATSVAFRKANLALKVKPQVTPDGNIIMTLDIKQGLGRPEHQRRFRHRYQARPDPGAGGERWHGGDRGHYTQTLQTTITKVPFFGDLPFLGSFSATTRARTTRPSSWCSSPRASSNSASLSQR